MVGAPQASEEDQWKKDCTWKQFKKYLKQKYLSDKYYDDKIK